MKGLDAYPDTVNEEIEIMNNYHATLTIGLSIHHTTCTSRGVQFEKGQGPNVA